MTPLAGFVIAVIAGWITRDARRAAAIFLIPFLAVVAVQTWGIAAGDGNSPPDTVWPFSGAISYYVVQVIIMAFALAVAVMLGAVRARRAGPADAGARRTITAAAVDYVLTASFVTSALLVAAPVQHHSENGAPPVYGLLGIAVNLISVIVLSVLLITGRRAAARDRRAVADNSAAVAR